MKKTLMGLMAIALVLVLTVVTVGSVMAGGPAKDKYDGKTAGNTGFANIVDTEDVQGWVRYGKSGKSLKTTWVIKGLQPGAEYQLKLHSKFGDSNVANACGAPNEGPIWMCGTWGGESFLVMDIVQANPEGHIGVGVNESRLPAGDYEGMQFIVTLNASPWTSYWTWQNPWPTISSFTIK